MQEERDFMELKGRSVLITGGVRRLGLAIAQELARAGAVLVVHQHHADETLEGLRALLPSGTGPVHLLSADFSQPRSAEALFEAARKKVGELDLLVNSASIFPRHDLNTLTWEQLNDTLRINTWAPMVLARSLAAAGRPAKIVNLLDTRIDGSDPEHLAYLLSKQLLASLTRIMAVQFAPGIQVNGVAPGLILPPPGEDAAYLQARARDLPLQRPGTPADVARAVRFLLESEYTTGEIVHVDGGRHVREVAHGHDPHQ